MSSGLPNEAVFLDAFRGRRVFVTGHTGFKGAWLCAWLLHLGAEVTGYALPPQAEASLFQQLGLAERMLHVEGDLCDADRLSHQVREAQPDFVFHLAAQSLVRLSYEQPRATFAVNAMGTLHLLEALRDLPKSCPAVLVTTDKCYENREWVHGYREEDSLGGHDPYSASKAAAEIIIASYRRSFFPAEHPVKIASVRAGNVIGGGDWALDRIVPDCIRALRAGEAIAVRNRTAVRPWQHVLEPLSGYLWLAALLAHPQHARGKTPHSALCGAFNFGPTHESNRSVAELVEEVLQHWPGAWVDRSDAQAPHEARLLQLSTDKANALLGWSPVWNFSAAIAQTVRWYRAAAERSSEPAAALPHLTLAQIELYTRDARALRLPWASPPATAKSPAAPLP